MTNKYEYLIRAGLVGVIIGAILNMLHLLYGGLIMLWILVFLTVVQILYIRELKKKIIQSPGYFLR